jgi:hypothetical protein
VGTRRAMSRRSPSGLLGKSHMFRPTQRGRGAREAQSCPRCSAPPGTISSMWRAGRWRSGKVNQCLFRFLTFGVRPLCCASSTLRFSGSLQPPEGAQWYDMARSDPWTPWLEKHGADLLYAIILIIDAT